MSLEEINNNFTDGQKNTVYRKVLVPLKLKISEILLYDTEAALEFLKEYNEIIKNEEAIGDQIIQKAVDLELRMQSYMSSTGKEKMYNEQSNTLIQQIDDLEIHYMQISLEEFEQQLQEIKSVYYSNSANYSFQNKEEIEKKINSLQANLIMQKASMETIFDMKEMITEDNKEGLTMHIYSELSKLMQSQDKSVKRIGNELKTIIANGNDFLYDIRTWRLLDSAQRNIITTNQKQTENRLSLPAVQNKKAISSFFDTIFGSRIKIGDKKMKVKQTIQFGAEEINVKQLSKIDIYWLACNVPKEMLEEIETRRLYIEGENVVEKYIPDARTPIYDYMSQDRKKITDKKIYFFNEEGIKVKMKIIRDDGSRCWYKVVMYGEEDTKLECHIDSDILKDVNEVYEYAKFIDSIINSNLEQELANEIGVSFEKRSITKYFNILEETMRKLPIYSNLLKSYKKIEEEYKETKISFRAEEKAKRDNFYQQNRFKNRVAITSNENLKNKKEQKKSKDKKREKKEKYLDMIEERE